MIKRRFVSIILACFSFILFALLSKYEDREMIRRFDFDMTVRIQSHIPARFDEMWEDLGFIVSPVVSSVIVLVLTAVAFMDLKTRRVRWWALGIPIAFASIVLFEIYGKEVVKHPPPPFFMLKNPTTIFPRYYVQEGFSYPSGHAARSIYIAFVTTLVLWQSVRQKKIVFWGAVSICFGLAFVISLGKVYLGQHWTTDILGGLLAALGCFGMLASIYSWPKVLSERKPRKEVSE